MMFARTKRLTLRPGWPEDACALTAAIAHESVAMTLSRVPWPYGESDARAWLTMPRTRTDVSCLILAHDTPTPRLIGTIGLHPVDDTSDHELGYWLTPDAWGRGYATEAGQAMLDIARHALGLDRVVAGHFIDNPASGAVLRKLGFRPTGVVERRFSRARGHHVECATFVCDLTHDDLDRPMPIAA